MIPVTGFENRKVAILGLGRSGLAAARALKAGGAIPVCGDDNTASVEAAAREGFATADLADPASYEGVALLVLSPGIPHLYPHPHPAVATAFEAGVPVDNDVGLFFTAVEDWRSAALASLVPDDEDAGPLLEDLIEDVIAGDIEQPGPKVVCITGSNGKSTTTALIGHILAEAGLGVAVGGNIGRGVLDLDPPEQLDTIYVLELSSYQTELARALAPDVAVFLNLSPDHLDRHGGFGGYFAAKRRLFEMASGSTAVVGVDEQEGRFLANSLRFDAETSMPVIEISAKRDLSGHDGAVYVEDGHLVETFNGREAGRVDLAPARALAGRHNWQNAAAAYAACRSLGLEADEIAAGLASFPGLPHRMERVGERGGVLFVNDSKATNADAAEKALLSYERVRWIAGGKPKEGGIAALTPLFGRIAKAYLIGEAAADFAATLGATPHVVSGTLAEAVAAAAAEAAPGEVVLLSPACASFDQFRDFEARGKAFRDLVLALEGVTAVGGEG